MEEYNLDNIFAKILRGEIPSYKIFETEHSIAILDAFPVVDGHSLLIPKLNGHLDLSTMSENQAMFLTDLPKLARIVKTATGADSVNIISNLGKNAGQLVFHPHVHVIPRFVEDNLFKWPKSRGMITEETAKNVLDKMKI